MAVARISHFAQSESERQLYFPSCTTSHIGPPRLCLGRQVV